MAKKARKKESGEGEEKISDQEESRQEGHKGQAQDRRGSVSPKPRPRRNRAAPPKPRGILAKIVADFEAVIDTLADADNLHRKLEPKISREPE